jgi:hypothetical protein
MPSQSASEYLDPSDRANNSLASNMQTIMILVMHIILLVKDDEYSASYRHSLASYGLRNTAPGISRRSLSVYSLSMLQIL